MDQNRSDLQNQLTRAADARNALDQVLWLAFSLFTAAHCLVVSSLFSSESDMRRLIICFGGIVLGTVWVLIQQRIVQHLKRNDNLIEVIETDLQLDPKYCLSLRINKNQYAEFFGAGGGVRWLVVGFPLSFMMFWCIGFSYFLFYKQSVEFWILRN